MRIMELLVTPGGSSWPVVARLAPSPSGLKFSRRCSPNLSPTPTSRWRSKRAHKKLKLYSYILLVHKQPNTLEARSETTSIVKVVLAVGFPTPGMNLPT